MKGNFGRIGAAPIALSAFGGFDESSGVPPSRRSPGSGVFDSLIPEGRTHERLTPLTLRRRGKAKQNDKG